MEDDYFFRRHLEKEAEERDRLSDKAFEVVDKRKNALMAIEAYLECARIRGLWCEELEGALGLVRGLRSKF